MEFPSRLSLKLQARLGIIYGVTSKLAIKEFYQGLFYKGFLESEIPPELEMAFRGKPYFVKCLNDEEKLQFGFMNLKDLDAQMISDDVGDEEKKLTHTLQAMNSMGLDEIEKKCIAIRPYMKTVIDTWSLSSMQCFNLTSVGIALAHANIQRLIGAFADLSMWIN